MARPAITIVALASMALSALAGIAGAAEMRSPDTLERLVRQDCGACHGITLKGGLGPAITPDQVREIDDASLSEIIRDGIPGTPMPPWGPLLGPGELDWIVDYLKGRATP